MNWKLSFHFYVIYACAFFLPKYAATMASLPSQAYKTKLPMLWAALRLLQHLALSMQAQKRHVAGETLYFLFNFAL